MRRIVKNKVYDTDTAKRLGSADEGAPGSISHVGRTLYRKKNGEYFVHCEGGSATRYAKDLGGGSWAPGEAVEPMGFEAAREWAEENLPPDEYEAAFGIPEEGTAAVYAEVSAAAKAKLDREAASTGRTVAQVIESLAESL